MDIEVEVFKKELSLYEAYKEQLIKVQEESKRIYEHDQNIISDLYYKLSGLSAVYPLRTPSHGNPQAKIEYQHKLMEQIEKAKRNMRKHIKIGKEKELRLQLQIDYVEKVLNNMSEEDRKICIDVICHKRDFKDITNDLGKKKSRIYEYINKLVEKAIKF